MSYQQPAPQQNKQPLDKGQIRVVIGQYHKKQNGQFLYNNNQPVMGNRYTTIGEVTRWPGDQGGYYDRIEFYPGFTILDCNKEGMIFWDSQNQQAAPQPQQPAYQQPAAAQQAPRYQQGR
jgi:hypothetical protein